MHGANRRVCGELWRETTGTPPILSSMCAASCSIPAPVRRIIKCCVVTMSVFSFEPYFRMTQQVLQSVVPPLGNQSYSRMAGLSANQFQMLERLRQLRSWQERQQEILLQQQQQELIALKSARTVVVQTGVEQGMKMF